MRIRIHNTALNCAYFLAFFLPTIETCLNCFGTRSSDAKIIKRRLFRPGNSKVTRNLSTPPPLAGERESPRWRQCLKEKFVPNRYTIHQSTPRVLSVYRDQSMQGEGEKRGFFPHTQLGTKSKGAEVSGFHTYRKNSAKIEISTNIYSWVGVKLIYHLNFNDI